MTDSEDVGHALLRIAIKLVIKKRFDVFFDNCKLLLLLIDLLLLFTTLQDADQITPAVTRYTTLFCSSASRDNFCSHTINHRRYCSVE